MSSRPQRRPRPGSKLDAVLRARGLSLYKLAKTAGLKYNTAVAVLNGRPRRQTPEEKIAGALGLPVDELFPLATKTKTEKVK